MISLIGNPPSLASLFEGGGLSMDLFTSHESGREENFLVDLFVVLVSSSFATLELLITWCKVFIVHNTKEKFISYRHKIRLWMDWSEYVSVSGGPSLVFEDHCKSSYSIHSRAPHHQTFCKNKQLSVYFLNYGLTFRIFWRLRKTPAAELDPALIFARPSNRWLLATQEIYLESYSTLVGILILRIVYILKSTNQIHTLNLQESMILGSDKIYWISWWTCAIKSVQYFDTRYAAAKLDWRRLRHVLWWILILLNVKTGKEIYLYLLLTRFDCFGSVTWWMVAILLFFNGCWMDLSLIFVLTFYAYHSPRIRKSYRFWCTGMHHPSRRYTRHRPANPHKHNRKMR